jgi:protein TonB
MTTPRYLLPVSIAAALHAALLFGFPGKSVRVPSALVEVPVCPRDPAPEDPVIPPPEISDDDIAVKPLAGGPVPPEIEPVAVVTKIDDFATPVEWRPRDADPHARILPVVPGTMGPGTGAGDLPAIFTRNQLDAEPHARVQSSPAYPARMRQEGIGGSVLVEFEVNTAGEVVRAEAVSCSRREFAEPALRAVRQWRFEPGRRHGRAVPFRLTVPVEFAIGRN